MTIIESARSEPIAAADLSVDPEAWHAARRGNRISATQIRDLAKGGGADRRRIMGEKLGDIARADLSGNRYVAHGNEREPIIAAWIRRRFMIEPSNVLYIAGHDDLAIATPDGVSRDPFTGEIVVSEIKTSKHDLTPGEIDPDSMILVMKRGRDGRWRLDTRRHFASTGYYDQMQWQMHVMSAERTLFVWEQHHDFTPVAVPEWCWVLRDQRRIDELIAIRDEFVAELEAERQRRANETPAEIEAQLAVVASLEEDERVLLAREVARGREIEAEGKRIKEAAWKRLGELAEQAGEDFRIELEDVSVSWTTTTKTKTKFDEQLARTKAPGMFAKYDALRERYTIEYEDTTTTLNVTTPRAK